MARKGQVSIQDSVETNEEFEHYLNAHLDQLICLEVYSDFCGPCVATANAIRKGKMEIGGDRIAMVKGMSDHIDALSRFKDKSEPVFLFISNGKLTRALFGANGLELCRLIEEELALLQKEKETGLERVKQAISEMLPEETEKMEYEMKIEAELAAEENRLRVITLAARKKRVNERLADHVAHHNYILFFPHSHQAYYDLYENWDMLNIQVGAKEEIQITEDMVSEFLYMSDVEPNDACLYALRNGPALVVLFKKYDTDTRNFVQLLRHMLYEMIPEPKDDVPPEKQRDEEEERARLKREQERLAREAEEERLAAEKQRKEEEKMARLAAGLPGSPEPEPVTEAEELAEGEESAGEGGEGLPEGEKAEQTDDLTGEAPPTETEVPPTEVPEDFHSDVEVEGEDYIPPGGLFVPGLYSPPNDLAKANGLKLFFPKVVAAMTKVESEHLPPHCLVMFPADKREGVKEILDLYPDEMLHVGMFHGDELQSLEHLAYSIKQYDKLERGIPAKYKDRVAVMVSRKRSLPLLQLAGLGPTYISIDQHAAVHDCLTLFPVGYGDDFFEEESVVEEEIVELPPAPEPTDEGEPAERVDDEEDEEED